MLVLKNLSKQYGQRDIFNDVNLTIRGGEVAGIVDHEAQAILELVKMMSGQEKPDGGSLQVDDYRMIGTFRPYKYNVGIIRREPQLIESLDIASNIFLGHEPRLKKRIAQWFNLLDQYQVIDEAVALLSRLNFTLPPVYTPVGDLSFEQRQLVAIAQLIVQKPGTIVIDHPGRSLSLPYLEQLFDQIHRWRDANNAVIIGTSNLDSLFAVCDRIIVLRNGKVVMDAPSQELTREDIVATLVSERSPGQIPPVIWALDSYYQALRQAQLLRHQQQLLEQDLAQQNSIKQQLLEQLSVQVSALDDANLALQDAQRRLLTERENERKHLARELHDQVIQDLLTYNYRLEELIEDNPLLHDDIHDIRNSVRDMVEDIRHICGRLRPPTIDTFGLETTLQSYTHSFSERYGIAVDLQVDSKIGRLSEDIELSLFRIIQESLNNTAKHANASTVSIHLNYRNQRLFQLLISDDGVGLIDEFDLGQLSRDGHFGLLGITERVALFGGSITFRNRVGGGLQIEVEVPHQGQYKRKTQ